MFLRYKVRRKDGKEHRYWSIVENHRVSGGRTVQLMASPVFSSNNGVGHYRLGWRDFRTNQ